MRKLNIIKVGLKPYKEIWEFQKFLFDLRLNSLIDDCFILVEHYPVYTLGKNSDTNHLLINKEILKLNNIDLFEIDRGGDITYHGPGQLVGYPIIKLDDIYMDLHRYLRDLEELIITTLKEFNISGKRDEDYTGVWVGKDKIAAIGVKVSRWITMHGFALNVNNDLKYFDNIIPCGIFHKGITSMEREIQSEMKIEKVISAIICNFIRKFDYADSVEIFFSKDEFLTNYLNKIGKEN